MFALLLAAPAAHAAADGWTPYDRPADYGTVTDSDVQIVMRDGTVLVADVTRPDKPGSYPVIVTQTPYNKNGVINIALGGTNSYFAQRGYATVTVDVRGTGGSQGVWDSFGDAEQRDGPEIVAWAAKQAWSDGKVGLYGPSYMAINQLFTAAQKPPALKAIFPIVPSADVYRDIVFTGGAINVSFIPIWLGLVTATSMTPPAYATSGDPDDLVRAITALASHVAGIGGFQATTVLGGLSGGDAAFDGAFWKQRSPIEVLDRIDVPAFVVGGHHDLFQRGEPLVYERLRDRVPARLLMGPWNHLTGSTGAGLPRDGVPPLPQIALRWFDHWLQGRDTKIDAIPKVTQYVYGDERYETQPDWPDPRLTPTKRYLRGGGSLSGDAPAAAEAPQSFTQHPLSGICTQSTSQWTAGILDALPCTSDNRPNEALGEAVYTTPPLGEDLQLSGPVLANLWLTTTARDAAVTLRLTDVDPTGRSSELSAGWLAASFRAVDGDRSRRVRGQMLQPWHPFTRASVLPVPAGEPIELAVEVFPVRAAIKRGHRLRVTVGPSDFPHQIPPLPQLAGGLLGQVKILTEPGHASSLTLPGLGECERVKAAAKKKAKANKKKKRKAKPRRKAAAKRKPASASAQAQGGEAAQAQARQAQAEGRSRVQAAGGAAVGPRRLARHAGRHVLGPRLAPVAVIGAAVEPGAEAAADLAGDRHVDDAPRPLVMPAPGGERLARGEHLGAAEVGRAAERLALDQLRHTHRHLGGGDRLGLHRQRQRRDRPAAHATQRHLDQLMELGGAEDRVRPAGGEDRLLAGELALVVAERDPVDADDRDVEQMAGIGGGPQQLLGLGQVGLAAARAGLRRRVDDQLRPGGGRRDALARAQIALVRACARAPRQHPHLVVAPAQELHDLAAEDAAAAGDEDHAHTASASSIGVSPDSRSNALPIVSSRARTAASTAATSARGILPRSSSGAMRTAPVGASSVRPPGRTTV